VSRASVAPRPTCRACSGTVASAAIYFCRACESKLPGGRIPSILGSDASIRSNQYDIEIALEESLAEICRANGDKKGVIRHEHSAGLAKWRKSSKKTVDGIELRPPAVRSTPAANLPAREASDRILHTLKQLKREGFDLELLKLACDDAQTRLSNKE
jgi:hypothetical protein